MSTKFKFIRDVSGTVSDNLPLSDVTETMNLVGSETTAFFDVPKNVSSYVVTFKYASNQLENLTADRVNVDVRFFPYPPSDVTYSNPVALLISGGARVYVSQARPDVDTDVLIHASLYEAGELNNRNLTQGEATLLGITITPDTVSVAVGNTRQFTAMGYYSDETFVDITTLVTWRVDLEEVATIGLHTGLLTAVAEGYAVVDATYGSINSNEAQVTVGEAVVISLAIAPVNPSADIGGTIQFIATATLSDGSQEVVYPTEWYTNNEEVVIISSNGLAEAISEGTADIGCYITTSGGDIIAPQQTMTVTVAAANDYINYTPNGQFGVLNDYMNPGTEIDVSSFYGKENRFFLSGYADPQNGKERYGNISFYKYGIAGGADVITLERLNTSEGIEANPMYWMHHYCSNISNQQSIRRYYEFVIGDALTFAGKTITMNLWGKCGADSQGAIRFVLRLNYGNGAPDTYINTESDIFVLDSTAKKISSAIYIDDINRSFITDNSSTFSIIVETLSANDGYTNEFDVYFTNVQINLTDKILPYQYIAADKLRVYKRSVEMPAITSMAPSSTNAVGDVLTMGASMIGQTGVYLSPTLSYMPALPVGTVVDYLAEVDPPEGGWLNCCIGYFKSDSGFISPREVSKTQYPRLFNTLNPTAGIPMFGNCGCYVQNTGEEGADQLRVYNQYSYSGAWLPDYVVGLNGLFTIEKLFQSYNVTRITCPKAVDFDAGTGYIVRYTSPYDTYSGSALAWYIVFIKNNNYAIHPDVPINTSSRIVYVHIQENYSAADVAAALSSAIDHIGFYLPFPNGYVSRCWDNGAGRDPDTATRGGRSDSLNGDHVGTTQGSAFGIHTHTKNVINFWVANLGVGSGIHPLSYVSDNPTSVASPTPLGTFILNETGGNETRGSNISVSKIIKY